MFAVRLAQNGGMVGCHNGLLVVEDVSSGGSTFKFYGESTMKVTRMAFPKWGNRLLETTTDKNVVQLSMWIAADSFSANGY